MAKLALSVVIPNWNGLPWLDRCLGSLSRQTLAPQEIIVVDDASTDGSGAFLQEKYPPVKVLALSRNGGFCKAVNAGLRLARGEAILLLNNDTELHPDCLAVMSRALAQYPQVSFFAPRMMQADGRRIDSAGVTIDRQGRLKARAYGETLEAEPPAPEGELSAEPVFGNSAGAGLYRRRLFEDIGLFDEDFFMYLEDVDLDFRARLRGHSCFYLPQAVVYHLGSATLGADNPQVVRWLVRNHLLVLAKSLPLGLFLKYFPALFWQQLRSARFYAGQGYAGLFCRAQFAALGKTLLSLKKRRSLQAHRVVDNQTLEELLTP